MLGLHLIDWVVITTYFLVVVVIGLYARRRIKTTEDFYQGGRSFGKIITMFLSLGTITDATQASAVSSEIYRQGLSGVWFQNLVLFHTPFQWFISSLQRRARYIAPADIFLHRFESKTLAGIYASVLVATAIYSNSFGFLLTGKTLQAIMAKAPQEYTQVEMRAVKEYEELKSLKTKDLQQLNQTEKSRIVELEEKEKSNQIYSFASHLNLRLFYLFYAIIIALYTVVGGLFAIAIIDVIQGILIMFLSLSMIPIAMAKIGGFTGLSGKLSLDKLDLFGSSSLSDYTWYFVASFALLNLVVNAPKNFGMGGSAKDDKSARIGFVGGAMIKRVMMFGWAITGLLAVALYSGKVSDPANIWGFMAQSLLGYGALGLMIAAIFSANMDGSATVSLDAAAAFTKNIYIPMKQYLKQLQGAKQSKNNNADEKNNNADENTSNENTLNESILNETSLSNNVKIVSEKKQMMIGRVVVLLVLLPAIFFAEKLNDILVVFKYILSVGTITAPSIWLAYFWRRLTTKAVAAQMLVSIILIIILPNLIPKIDSFALDQNLTQKTQVQFEFVKSRATENDKISGLAKNIGDEFLKKTEVPQTPIFFDKVIKNTDSIKNKNSNNNANNSNVEYRGDGLFKPQIWLLSKLGIDFTVMKKPQIATAGFLFDAIFPFILLILFSLFTKRNSQNVLNDFYARVNTPAVANPELDAKLVQEKIDNPDLVRQNKLFPNTNIEFWKPTRFDTIGFLVCLLFVVVMVFAYILLAKALS